MLFLRVTFLKSNCRRINIYECCKLGHWTELIVKDLEMFEF